MGANKIQYWFKVIERIKSSVSAWKARWLSFSGHILLIKSVLADIPNYYIDVLKAPKPVILHIEKIIRNFLWRGNLSDVKKIPLILLDNMASDKLSSGVGIHNISKRNLAFGGKLVWHMYSKSDSKWCQIMQAKYLGSLNPSRIFTISNPM